MSVNATRPARRPVDQVRGMFFDRERVLRAVDRSTRRNLSWFGGYVRRVARNSLKSRKAVSAPGSPPSTHATYQRPPRPPRKGKPAKPAKAKRSSSFRDSVLYSFDPATKTVVAGPVLFATGRTDTPTPGLLEYGGPARTTRGGTTFTAHYRPRPFMRPAMATTVPKFFERLKGSVH